MGRYCFLWLLDSEPSGMGTDTGSWECMCSFRSRVAPSEKSLLVSCALCHIFTVQHPLQSGCPRKPQDSVLISQGLQQQQLGMGGPAGATAGFAVIPVATEVHFDCQCTVGAWLVLAAVIWGLCGAWLQVTSLSANRLHQWVTSTDNVGSLVTLHVSHPHTYPTCFGAL